MKERIRLIRDHFGLSQLEFAEKIGLKQSTVAGYETGAKNPSRLAIESICNKFSVNEAWLRDGIGEMFAPRTTTEELTDFFADIIHEDSFRRRLVTVLSRIPPDEWKVIEKYALQLLEECKENPPDK